MVVATLQQKRETIRQQLRAQRLVVEQELGRVFRPQPVLRSRTMRFLLEHVSMMRGLWLFLRTMKSARLLRR